MKDTQSRKYNMGIATLHEIDEFNSVWSGNANATAKRDQLEDDLQEIADAETAQQASSGDGPHITKEEAKHDMAEQTEVIAQCICAWAIDNNDNDVYEFMNKRAPAIEKMKDIASKDYCAAVRQYAFDHSADLLNYNVSNAMITNLLSAVNLFAAVEPGPTVRKGHYKTATGNVGLGITHMMTTLVWWDHFVGGLKVTQPAFFSDFTTARHINDSGVRKVSIRGTLTDSVNNTPLYRAKLSIVTTGTPHLVYSGRTGKYNLFSLLPGVYTIQVELEGYQTQTIPNVSVLNNQITDLNISLVAV